MTFLFSNVFGSWNYFGASLQASTLDTDITHIPSCRNVVSVEHTTSAVFVVFGLAISCRFEKGIILYGLVRHAIAISLQIFNT